MDEDSNEEYEEGNWLNRGALVWFATGKTSTRWCLGTSNRSQDRGGFGPSPSQGTPTAESFISKTEFYLADYRSFWE